MSGITGFENTSVKMDTLAGPAVAGNPPLYEHLAVLATASAICSVEWIPYDPSQTEELRAQLHHPDGSIEPLPKPRLLGLTGEVLTASGLKLTGRLDFSRWQWQNHMFPDSIDRAISASPNVRLDSSKVTLELPESDRLGLARRVGIKAVHAVRRDIPKPVIEPTIDVIGLEPYRGMLGLLQLVSADAASFKEVAEQLSHNQTVRKVHTDYVRHQFPGVPHGTILAAQYNFRVLDAFMDAFAARPLV